MSASRYLISENRHAAKENTTSRAAVRTAVVDRLNRLLGDTGRCLELEAMSRVK